MGWLYLVLVICQIVYQTTGAEQPIAETNLGKYKGQYVTTFEGKQISAFKGIRYAKTPKRFQEAEKVEAHDDEYDATDDGDDCLQINHNYNKYPIYEYMGKKVVGSEDCLFLNVYTPNLKPEKPLPVMVWIHGGGFMIGTSAQNWHGPELLLDRDVILVALNYRLDIFGFLAYDEEVLPGNIGLKDQSLALHWVKENIAKFGGDPESITIFGESAGGASVHLQMHSPRNKGVFHRAISQSGTMDCPWAFTAKSKAKDNALKVASFLKCPTSPQELLTCLQEKTSEQIMAAAVSLKQSNVALEMIFKPVLETNKDGFITEEDTKKRSTIPWIGGVNSGEGIVFYMELAMSGDKDLTEFNKHYKHVLPGLLGYETHPQVEKITKLIKHNYLGDEDFGHNTLKQFVNMISDAVFIRGHLESAKKHQGKHYLYLLTHEGERSITALIQAQDLGLGVAHGDELFYLFTVSKFHSKIHFNDVDKKVFKHFLDMWTNFAKTGNPTPDKNESQWYESENGKLYVTISPDGIELSKHLYSNRLSFWESLPTNLYQHHQAKDEL